MQNNIKQQQQQQLQMLEIKERKLENEVNNLKNMNKNKQRQRTKKKKKNNKPKNNRTFQNDRKMLTKRVTFSETIGNLTGSSNYSVVRYAVNPGNNSLFAWLSNEAAQWEKYKFESLKFEYYPSTNVFQPNSTGNVIMMFDSDSSEPPPITFAEVLNQQPSVSFMPYEKAVLNVPAKICNTIKASYYVRTGNLPPGGDINLFDCGSFFFATQGNTNSNVIGYLKIHYTVLFEIPQTPADPLAQYTNNTVTVLKHSVNDGQVLSSGSNSNMIWTGLTDETDVQNGLNVGLDLQNITMPKGNYLFFYNVQFICDTDLLSCAINLSSPSGAYESPYPQFITSNGGTDITDMNMNGTFYLRCFTNTVLNFIAVATFGGSCKCYATLNIVSV